MKSVILYAQETASFDHQSIFIRNGDKHTNLFIRAEVVEDDPNFALDHAKPRDGEIVLNSVPFPGENDTAQATPTKRP